MEEVTVIESFLGMRQGDTLGGFLFVLAHYRTFLKTIEWTPNYVFPSLADDTTSWGFWVKLLTPLTTFQPN
jgi:hypothetical protein